jgi:hypothetical protein
VESLGTAGTVNWNCQLKLAARTVSWNCRLECRYCHNFSRAVKEYPPPFQWRKSPQWPRASSLSRLHDRTQAHHTRWDSSGRVISPTQRNLPDNTQHSQETNIHDPGGIRIHGPSKRESADPRLRPRGHWDRPTVLTWVFRKRKESGANSKNG